MENELLESLIEEVSDLKMRIGSLNENLEYLNNRLSTTNEALLTIAKKLVV